MSQVILDDVRRTATLVAAAYAVVTVVQVATWTAPTTYAGTSAATAVLTALAGLAPIAAGCALWWLRPRGHLGAVSAALGAAWLAPVWVGWEDGNPLVRSLAMVVAPFVPVLALHFVVAAAPSAYRAVGRWALTAGYGVTTAYTVARAVVHDPFLDLDCWSNCSDNVLVAFADPTLAHMLDRIWAGVGATLLLMAAVMAAASLLGGPGLWRRRVLGAATAFALPAAGHPLLTLFRPEDAADPAFVTTYRLSAIALTALGVGVAIVARDEWRRTRALLRLVDSLDAEPDRGGIERVLAEALGDPGLRVAFRLPGNGELVDPAGLPAGPVEATQAEVPITRSGEVLAVVMLDPDLHGRVDLEAGIGPAARLAVDNERLRAGLAAQLRELRKSRLRVVERADEERRRLERNLHDGAQQTLLAVVFELGLAAVEVRTDAGAVLADEVLSARDAAGEAVEELRRFARGIYPAVLGDAGLEAALWSLADQAGASVEIVHVPDRPAPAATERVAYLVAERGVDRAVHAGCDAVSLDVRLENGHVRVTVDPFYGRPGPEILDRVGALGGRVDVAGQSLKVEVPCV